MNELASERLAADPRLAQAKQLILAALAEHTGSVHSIKAADPERKVSYQTMLDNCGVCTAGAICSIRTFRLAPETVRLLNLLTAVSNWT